MDKPIFYLPNGCDGATTFGGILIDENGAGGFRFTFEGEY